MPVSVLYPEARQQPDELERGVFGPDMRIVKRDADGAVRTVQRRLRRGGRADDHGVSGHRRRSGAVSTAARDRADGGRLRQARPARGGGTQHPDLQRARLRHDRGRGPRDRAGADLAARHPLAPRIAAQEPASAVSLVPASADRTPRHSDLRHLGLGRIGTAVALRAKAFHFRVVFYDPYLPNGVELALGIERAATLEDLLRQTNTLSIHAPLTPETRGMLGREQLALLPKGAVVVNDARGPIIDLDALFERCAAATSPAPGSTYCRWSRRSNRSPSCCGPTVPARSGSRAVL